MDRRVQISKKRDLVYSNDPDEITLNLIIAKITEMSVDACQLELSDTKAALDRHKKDADQLVEMCRLYGRKIKEEVQSEVLGPKSVKDKGERRGGWQNIIDYNEKRATAKRENIEKLKE